MRPRLWGISAVLLLCLTGCVPEPSPEATASPTPSPTTTASNPKPTGGVSVGGELLVLKEPTGVEHSYAYETWPADLVAVATKLFGTAPQLNEYEGDTHTPPQTGYVWPGLTIVNDKWPADKPGQKRMWVRVTARAVGAVEVGTPSSVKVGDTADSVASYPVFCTIDKNCLENQQLSSGLTTLRTLDTSPRAGDDHLVVAYVDVTSGKVASLLTTTSSFGTLYGVDFQN
jgi:hypothetical protein